MPHARMHQAMCIASNSPVNETDTFLKGESFHVHQKHDTFLISQHIFSEIFLNESRIVSENMWGFVFEKYLNESCHTREWEIQGGEDS